MSVFGGFGFSGGGVIYSSSDADVQAYYDAVLSVSGSLSATEAQAVEDFVVYVKGYGGIGGTGWAWNNTSYLYPILGNNIDSRRINLKDASNTNSWLNLSGSWDMSSHGLYNNGVGSADVSSTGSLFQYGALICGDFNGGDKIIYGNYISGSFSGNEVVSPFLNTANFPYSPGSATYTNGFLQTNAFDTTGSPGNFMRPNTRDRFQYQWTGGISGYGGTIYLRTDSSAGSSTYPNATPGTNGRKATIGGAWDNNLSSVGYQANMKFDFLWFFNDLVAGTGLSTLGQLTDKQLQILQMADDKILYATNKIPINYDRTS